MKHIFAFVIVLMAALFCCEYCWAQPPVPPLQEIKNDPPRQTVWEQTLFSGTNLRYWSYLADKAARYEFWSGIAVVVLGLFAVTVPLIFAPKAKSLWKPCVALLSVIALGVSIVFLIDNSADYGQLSSIHKQWNSLHTQWESLLQQRDDIPRDVLQGHIDALLAQRQAIENVEPAETDHDIMHQAWVDEMRARGFTDFIAKVETDREALAN
ncbi:MAG: hypothetical protein IH831_05170 [Planctomycetes bacterium]|nr:hypothetical protein [Planctomycetota bacterium]